MGHVSYSDFRQNLARYMDEVGDSHAELHVTRQGRPSIVVLSEDEYNSMMETLHLLRSPANADALAESIAELEAGKGTRRAYIPRG
jgi:antitoxin YefM